MSNKILLAIFMIGLAASARADGIGGGLGGANGIGAGIGDPDGVASEKISLTPVVGCTNQLVLDYSNSCALIGQGFGQ